MHVDHGRAEHRRQFGQREIVGGHQADRAEVRPARGRSLPRRCGGRTSSCRGESRREETASAPGRAPPRRWRGCGESPRRSASGRPAGSPRREASRRARAPTAAGARPSPARPASASTTLTPDRSQQRALAGHVRAADDNHARAVAAEPDVVPDRHGRRNQRVAERGGVEHRPPLDQLRKRIGRPLVRERGERRERFELADGSQPLRRPPVRRSPCHRSIATASCGRSSRT